LCSKQPRPLIQLSEKMSLRLLFGVLALVALSASSLVAASSVAAASDAQEAAFLELESELDASAGVGVEGEDAPSWTLPYPAITYAATNQGGFFHPFSQVNPLAAPWGSYAPVATHFGPAWSSAVVAGSPASAYVNGYVHPQLGVNHMLFPSALAGTTTAKGGYNVHGLTSGNAWGGYHPGLAADLESLGGKKKEEESFVETAVQMQAKGEGDAEDADNIMADADGAPYGLFPAPTAASSTHFVRSASHAAIGPHKLNYASVGENELDSAFPALLQMTMEAHTEVEAEAADGCVNCVWDN